MHIDGNEAAPWQTSAVRTRIDAQIGELFNMDEENSFGDKRRWDKGATQGEGDRTPKTSWFTMTALKSKENVKCNTVKS